MDTSGFEAFAAEFVRAYWEVVKSPQFSMPPDEPVVETIDELLAAVSHSVGYETSSTCSTAPFWLHMSGQRGDWWDFRFHQTADGWRLVNAAARSEDQAKSHNLLAGVYAPYFAPFLRRVTGLANKRIGIFRLKR
jgi:hypothetical protein